MLETRIEIAIGCKKFSGDHSQTKTTCTQKDKPNKHNDDEPVSLIKSIRMQVLILRAGQCLALGALSPLAGWTPAQADSTQATCWLSRHDHTMPVETGPCRFSQRQGNANVRFNHWAFHFPSAEQGKTYQRTNTASGIRFNREGAYTLQVRWASKDQSSTTKPENWATDNIDLGR